MSGTDAQSSPQYCTDVANSVAQLLTEGHIYRNLITFSDCGGRPAVLYSDDENTVNIYYRN